MNTPTMKVLTSSDGTTIYAEAIGDPRNPAVVLAHGMCLSAAAFDGLFRDKRLLDKLYLVRYDLRGHGRSGMPAGIKGYRSSLWADDYAAVLKAFGLTKSYGATVVADVCAHTESHPFIGLVFVAPLPYIGPVNVGTPTVLRLIPGLMNTTDVALSSRTRVKFVDSCFNEPVDFGVRTSLIGQTILQPPEVEAYVLSRPQDPQKMWEAARAGLPLLLLNGTEDKQVSGEAVVRELSPHYTKMEVRMIEGGSHALFMEKQDECVEALLTFVARLTVGDGCFPHALY
ncbi:predicted protein [Postia placenta Mad-698-R]|nr:predicted protein [Postia placenta Mad-698-R]